MKILKYVAFLLLITIIGTALYIAVQPNEFSVSTSRIIPAPSAVLFKKINDFKNWPEFSPWMEQEPNANLTYGEKTEGTGAYYVWEGPELGNGSFETVETSENQFIAQEISFKTPLKSDADMRWNFEPAAEGTKVTWSMQGTQDFMSKMYTVFSGSIEDKTIQHFERGLFKLDSVVTADMKKYSIEINGITDHGGGYYLYNTTSSKINDLPGIVSKLIPKISNYAKENNIALAGRPFLSYITWDEKNNAVIFSTCVPTTDRVITTDFDIQTGELPSFKALKTTLKGDYVYLREAWDMAMDHMSKNGLELDEDGPELEVFITEPAEHPNPADWVTNLYIPLK